MVAAFDLRAVIFMTLQIVYFHDALALLEISATDVKLVVNSVQGFVDLSDLRALAPPNASTIGCSLYLSERRLGALKQLSQ